MSNKRIFFAFFILFPVYIFGCSHIPTTELRSPSSEDDFLSDCDIKLSTTGSPIEFSPTEMNRLKEFRKVLDAVTLPSRHEVDLKGLNSNKKVNHLRAQQIVNSLIDSKSELNQEIATQIADLGGLQSPKLWDFYFKSYDKAVAYADGYLMLMLMNDAFLPKLGRNGFFGTGSGNDSATAKSLAPGRYIVMVDKSPDGIELAKAKLHLITKTNSSNDSSQFEAHVMDITKDRLPPNSLDSATMINVLYTTPNKLEVLRSVFDSLKPGGIFILNDPADIIKQNKETLRKFMMNVALGAVENGSPISEYELAMVGAINVQVLMRPPGIFSTPDALKTLALEAGFNIRGYYSGYYGTSTFLVLQKPLKY